MRHLFWFFVSHLLRTSSIVKICHLSKQKRLLWQLFAVFLALIWNMLMRCLSFHLEVYIHSNLFFNAKFLTLNVIWEHFGHLLVINFYYKFITFAKLIWDVYFYTSCLLSILVLQLNENIFKLLDLIFQLEKCLKS